MPRVGLMALLAIPDGQSQLSSVSFQAPPTSPTFTCFSFQRLKVKDGHSGGLAPGSSGCRN